MSKKIISSNKFIKKNNVSVLLHETKECSKSTLNCVFFNNITELLTINTDENFFKATELYEKKKKKKNKKN